MTVYHVWLTGHDEPEVVRAYGVQEINGAVSFHDERGFLVRGLHREEWHKWAVVQDDADTVHL